MHVTASARLNLGQLTSGDTGFILRVLTDRHFVEFVGDRGVRDQATAAVWLEEGPIRSYRDNGWGLWKVSLRDSGEAIGICGFIRRPALRAPDLGYALLAPYAGKGYATEAAQAALGAVGKIGLGEVLAVVKPRHAASIRVLEKCGFKRDGEVQLQQGAPHLALYARTV
jgi:[ribosomal protein S5]-alanine N-acetyltransferase